MQYVFALYCISKGLCVANISVAARCSHQIGEYHLAKLFCIFGDRGSNFEYEGDKVLKCIYEYPETLNFLKKVDVINIDKG